MRKQRFLEALAGIGTILHSARAAGISPSQVYQWRLKDPKFEAAYLAAKEANTQNLEASAYKRAMEGDTVLTIFLLKSRRPEIYRDRIDVRAQVDATYRAELDEHIDAVLHQLEPAQDPLMLGSGSSNGLAAIPDETG